MPNGRPRQGFPAGWRGVPVQALEFHLWPENVPALELWGVVATQWRQSDMGGRTGLDYTAVQSAMRLHDVPRSERAARFEDLRTMERSALSVWARQRAAAHAGHGRPNG